MKKKCLVCVLGCSLSFSASAVTIDFRHEYTDDSKVHKERILISHRFASGLGFSVESKVKSGGDHQDRPFNDIVDNGTEYNINYQYKITPAFNIQPGFILETGSSKAIYKPNLRSQYNFDNGIYVAGRYRYEYTRETTKGKDDEHLNRGEGWLGYRFDSWRFELNYIYRKSDQIRYNNKKHDYEYNSKVAYNINKSWTPYVELGNVSVNRYKSDRQTRYRAGLQYHF